MADIFRRKQPGEAWETAVVDLSGGSSGPGTFSVTDYGAVLDGVTDDSPGIQAAIDAAHDAGGGVVVIPGKVFSPGTVVKVNTPLEMRAGVWLRGIGEVTSLRGTANPMIRVKAEDGVDRIHISDLFLQDPDGVGIKLMFQGAYQLGWSRCTVERVTVADAVSHSFWLAPFCIEVRFINCVSMRAGGDGFKIEETDNMLIGCTSAESTLSGFNISGGNNKLTGCKAYGNDRYGFEVGGAGRHMVAGSESQDNVLAGFYVNGTWNTLSGCLADSDGGAGVWVTGPNNSIHGSFMYGGGGSGQVVKAGVFFDVAAINNVVSGVTNAPAPVGGKAAGNTVYMNSGPGSRKEIAFASPWTPNPYDAEIQAMTLTNNLTLVNPSLKHAGQRLTLELRQDNAGARTVTFPAEFRTSWTPDTAANKLNVISFEYDGTAWQQTGSVTGLTAKPSIGVADTFNRANGAIGTSSSGHVWETAPAGGSWQVVSNQAKTSGATPFSFSVAVLEASVPDYTVQVTAVTHSVFAGLAWRYSDSSNYYRVAGNAIHKVVAGVQTTIAAGVINYVSGDVLKVVVSGPTHFLYKNGALVYVFADAFNVAATKAGIVAAHDNDILDAFAID